MNKKFSFSTTLIIDDSEIDVLVDRRLMELTSFSENVIIAGTAEEALTRALPQAPELGGPSGPGSTLRSRTMN